MFNPQFNLDINPSLTLKWLVSVYLYYWGLLGLNVGLLVVVSGYIVDLLRVEIDAYPTSTNPKKTLVNMMIPKVNPLFI